MATILLRVNQTDNGKNLLIEDVTADWADTGDTGVTHVSIVITDPGGTNYTVIDEDVVQPAAQANLSWEIPATDVGFSDEYYDDGKYGMLVTYTTDPISGAVDVELYLDWETKYYDFRLVKDLSYKLNKTEFAYDTDTEKAIVFDILKRGMQYSASVGQTTKADYILSVIENFKKI